MTVPEARFVDGDKYMWDGAEYGSREEAETKAASYEENGFQTQVFGEEGTFVVYTRRVVTEIVLEGEAPPG